MKKFISTVALALSFFACANLLVPDVLRAGMMSSQLQTEQGIETIRKKLCSKEILPEIRKFGFSNDEALKIRDVITDANVLASLAQLGNEASKTEGTVRIDKGKLGRVQDALTQSVEKYANENLLTKIRHRGEKMAGLKTENRIASKLSSGNACIDGQVGMSEIRKALTRETLVAMGMSETDAGGIVDRVNGDDFERITQGDVKIAFGAGPGPTLGMLFVVLLIPALIVALLLLMGLTLAQIGIGFGGLTLFIVLANLISDAVGR